MLHEATEINCEVFRESSRGVRDATVIDPALRFHYRPAGIRGLPAPVEQDGRWR
jgi:hypothetical protein